jgi:hypothetical protein
MMTLKRAPIDSINAVTTIFMLILWLINLKGLRVLNIRRIFIAGMLMLLKIISIREVITIKKSI